MAIEVPVTLGRLLDELDGEILPEPVEVPVTLGRLLDELDGRLIPSPNAVPVSFGRLLDELDGYLHTGPYVRGMSPLKPICRDATTAVLEFEIVSYLPDTVDLPTVVVQVTFDGSTVETVYTGGAFQAPYSGTVVHSSNAIEDLQTFSGIQRSGGWPYNVSIRVDVTGLNTPTAAPITGGTWEWCTLPAPPPPALQILQVSPIDSNTLRVWFSEEPRHFSTLSENDALLRDNWAVSVVSGPGEAPIVDVVENPQPRPAFDALFPNAWSVDLRLDRRVLADTVYLTIGSGAIAAVGGSTLDPDPYDRDDHPGIFVRRPRAALRERSIDTLNPDGVDFRYDTFTGALVFDSRSDLDIEAGVSALQKRIIRRLLSSPGGFFHLARYGIGLRTKEIRRSTNLAALRTEIESQLFLEEEVERVSVALSTPAAGTLVVQISVGTRKGFDLSFTVTVPEDGPLEVS